MPQCGKLPHLPPKNTAVKRILWHKNTTGKCMEFPVWNELFTFSTGFSTTKGHQPYTHRNSGRSFLVSFGQKCGHSAFYKKESRRIFFAFYKPFPSGDLFFSNLEWLAPSFQHRAAAIFPCGKGGETCSFPHCFIPAEPSQSPAATIGSRLRGLDAKISPLGQTKCLRGLIKPYFPP